MFLVWNRHASNTCPNLLAGVTLLLLLQANPIWGSAPYSQSELQEVETSSEAKIREIREMETAQLKITLGRRVPTNRRADLYFRLAELGLEGYRAAFLLEGRVHEKRLERHVSDPIINRDHSRKFLMAGIKASQDILHLNIPYDKMDQVYYFLGFNYGELERPDESAQYFQQLVQRYPNSPFTAPSYKELGDYYYRKSQYEKALTYLQAGLKRMPRDKAPPLLHKIAWCLYRTRQYDSAIQTMKEAISRASQIEKYKPLKDEALRDMAMLMTEGGRVDQAIRYFQEVAGDQAYLPSILEKLGAQYERNADPAQSIAVYEALLKTKPESAEAFRVFSKLIELDLKRKNYDLVLKRLKDWDGGAAVKAAGNSPDTQAAAHNLKAMIRKTATQSHQNYRKTKNKNDLTLAEVFYSTYIEKFLKQEGFSTGELEKKDPKVELSEIRMYLAEVKQDLGKSAEAARIYRQVIDSPGDKKYSKEAATLWMASVIDAMKKEGAQHSNASAKAPSELERQFVEASDLLQTTLGETQETRESALRAAQVLAGYPSTRGDAITRIKALLGRSPRSKQALTAARLWVQLVNEPAQTEQLKAVAAELQANTGLMAADQEFDQGKLKKNLKDLLLGTKVSSIALLEKSQDFMAAALGYEEVGNATSQKDIAEKAYASALNSILKADAGTKAAPKQSLNDPIPPEISGAILRVSSTWAQRFPRSPQEAEALRTVATHALIRGSFDFSARIFEMLGMQFGDADSLESAARIQEAIGAQVKAQELFTRYYSLYSRTLGIWRVSLSLARLQEKNHAEGEANRSYQFCASGPSPIREECLARRADLYLRDKNEDRAKEIYRQLGGVPKGGFTQKGSVGHSGKSAGKGADQSSSPYVGYARYKLAAMMEEEASFVPLRLPEAQLQKALNQRLSFLEPLSRSYQAVVESGGPWAIAALHRLALWAYHFADEVDAIEPPASTREGEGSSAALAQFKKSLASVSIPLREKARLTWNQAYSQAVSHSVFSPALPEIADYLGDLDLAGKTGTPSPPVRAQGAKGSMRLSSRTSTDLEKVQLEAASHSIKEKLLNNTKDGSAWLDYGNYLWVERQVGMARLAFERSLALDPKNQVTLNNLGALIVLQDGVEDWFAVAEGASYFEQALKLNDFFIPAKSNLATLLNYYRNFSKAKSLWNQVLGRAPSVEGHEGLGVALQGLGNLSGAEAAFATAAKKAGEAGGEASRFIKIYHEGARHSLRASSLSSAKESDARDEYRNCVGSMKDLQGEALASFERRAVEHLKERCESLANPDSKRAGG